jgi:guanine deaminase
MDLGMMLPYQRSSKATNDLNAEDVVSLCIYRGNPEAVIETFVRGRSLYRAPEPELF